MVISSYFDVIYKMKLGYFGNSLLFLCFILWIKFKASKSLRFELNEKLIRQITNFSIINISEPNVSTPIANNNTKIGGDTTKPDKQVVSDLAQLNNKLNRINELINRYEKINNFTKNSLFFTKKFKFRMDNVLICLLRSHLIPIITKTTPIQSLTNTMQYYKHYIGIVNHR